MSYTYKDNVSRLSTKLKIIIAVFSLLNIKNQYFSRKKREKTT